MQETFQTYCNALGIRQEATSVAVHEMVTVISDICRSPAARQLQSTMSQLTDAPPPPPPPRLLFPTSTTSEEEDDEPLLRTTTRNHTEQQLYAEETQQQQQQPQPQQTQGSESAKWPPYELYRHHQTVLQVWLEYEEGQPILDEMGTVVGRHPSVRSLEVAHKATWRTHSSTERKYWSKRKVIYDEIDKQMRESRCTGYEIAEMMDMEREGLGLTLDKYRAHISPPPKTKRRHIELICPSIALAAD
ncbi:hypothetical protein DFJ77DRAFT_442964 [Powellomyces hirtus]|nr:hypothetical protein DFJ77DRAFT_442964 [Powellomyces hirtus]